ncbi:MAG: hypothetical protein L3J34_09490 [Flavobacteriaceae bacterium]|nr:hypothetical protein [Flavobacteriaceae bacterium]
MITKESLLKSINTMPDRFSIEEIMDRIVLLDKIEQGEKDSKTGNVLSEKETKYYLKKWLM